MFASNYEQEEARKGKKRMKRRGRGKNVIKIKKKVK